MLSISACRLNTYLFCFVDQCNGNKHNRVLIVNGLSGCKYAESFLNNLTNLNKFLSDDLCADVQMDKVVCESQMYDVCFDLLLFGLNGYWMGVVFQWGI